jgi:O-antigen/teichoic acid export membrane protein
LIIGFYIINESATQTSIILAYVISALCGLLVLIFGVLLFLNFKIERFSLEIFLSSFRKLYQLSKLYFMASTAKIGVKNFENVLIMKFLGSEAVGIYQSFLKLLSPINLLTAPLGSNYQRKMIDFYIDNKYKKLKDLVFRITKNLLFINLVYILIVMFFVDFYFETQKIQKIEYSTLLFLLLGILSLLQTSIWWSGNFMLCHFPKMPIYTNLITSILNIVVPYYSLYYYGYNGIIIFIIASLASQAPAYFVPFFVFRKYYKNFNG